MIAEIIDVQEKQNTRLATPISSQSKDKVETLKMATINIQTQSKCTLAKVLNVISEEEKR